MVQSQPKMFGMQSRGINELLEPRIHYSLVRKLKIRHFAITAPSKGGSLQLIFY